MPTVMPLDYGATDLPIREDLRAAHAAAWADLQAAGTWWTGAERVAIAAEVRHAPGCALCRERKAALSPFAVTGTHDGAHELPEHVVDVVHRIRTDPGRLSRAWFDGVVAAGLEPAPYVELVGITTLVSGLDYFCAALGIAPFALPAPLPGAPTRALPAGLTTGEAWVPMLAPESDDGRALFENATLVPNIVRSLSLVPDAVRTMRTVLATHYFKPSDLLDLTKQRTLDRVQVELVAARVSALNECFY
jgi:hypothetical protein